MVAIVKTDGGSRALPGSRVSSLHGQQKPPKRDEVRVRGLGLGPHVFYWESDPGPKTVDIIHEVALNPSGSLDRAITRINNKP